MRSLNKNKRTVWYATYSDCVTVYETDGQGNVIYDIVDDVQIPRIKAERAGYNSPVPIQVNMSASKGKSVTEVFGAELKYTKTFSTSDLDLPISETSLIWFETTPGYRQDGSVNEATADYEVAAVAISLNEAVYALRRRGKDG